MQWFNRHETVGLLLSPGFDVSYCVLVTLPSGFTKGITCSNMYGEAGGGEGEVVTRGQESRMRQNSQQDLRPQEMNPFKAGSPSPSHIGECRKTFRWLSRRAAELSKIGEAWGDVSEPKSTSRGKVKRVATLPASFASGAMPPTCTRIYPGMSSLTTAKGNKRGLDVISRDVMRSERAAGDKCSALDASDTDDDDGCAGQGEGAGAARRVPTLHKEQVQGLRRIRHLPAQPHQDSGAAARMAGRRRTSACEHRRAVTMRGGDLVWWCHDWRL